MEKAINVIFGVYKLKIIKNKTLFLENFIRRVFAAFAFTSLLVLFLIMIFLFVEGIPILKEISLIDFLFGQEWYPTAEPPQFGIFPLILASVSVTLVASIMAVPLSIAIAIYLSEIAPPMAKKIIKPIIEIIASIPSVVIGFFGMVVLGPFLQQTFDLSTGLNLFNASIMLAFMSIPTIASISEDAIASVPSSLKAASYALGANKWQTIYFVTLPASLSGVFTAIILGISRVIGETMVVLMVAGGAAMMPKSIFDPVRPLTGNIAAEMAEAPVNSDHYYALFAIGIILFFITFIFNIIASVLANKYKFKTS